MANLRNSTALLLFCILSFTQNVYAKCHPHNVAFIKQHVAHPMVFCNFYNERQRQLSPFHDLSVQQTTEACKCIANGNSVVESNPFAPRPRTCKPAHMRAVKGAFRNAHAFCRFYRASGATVSPVHGLNHRQTHKACECIIDAASKTETDSPTTTETQFCSSPAVTSLLADSTGASFCQSLLGVGELSPMVTEWPVTETDTVWETMYWTVCGKGSIDSAASTTESSVASITESPESLTTDAATTEPAVTPEPVNNTPGYLSGASPDYITSACQCDPALTVFPAVTTSYTPYTTTETVTSTTTNFDTPGEVTPPSYIEVSGTQFATWDNLQLVPATLNQWHFEDCPPGYNCSWYDSVKQTVVEEGWTDFSSCAQICLDYNKGLGSGGAPCTGVSLTTAQRSCYLMHDVEPLITNTTCAYWGGANATTGAIISSVSPLP